MPTPTQPAPGTTITFPSEPITAYMVTNLGLSVDTVVPFVQLTAGPNAFVGFSFNNTATGELCAGYVQTLDTSQQILVADYRCVAANAPAIAFPILVVLTDDVGTPVSGVMIYANPALLPNANGYTVVYQDGTPGGGMLMNFGALEILQQINLPTRVSIVDSVGNELTDPNGAPVVLTPQ